MAAWAVLVAGVVAAWVPVAAVAAAAAEARAAQAAGAWAAAAAVLSAREAAEYWEESLPSMERPKGFARKDQEKALEAMGAGAVRVHRQIPNPMTPIATKAGAANAEAWGAQSLRQSSRSTRMATTSRFGPSGIFVSFTPMA